jgi:hypothetical protein
VCKNLADFSALDNKFSVLLQDIATARFIINKMHEERIGYKSIDRQLHYRFEDTMGRIANEYSDLTIVLLQKAFRQRNALPAREVDIDRCLRVPDETIDVSEVFMKECRGAIYRLEFISKYSHLVPSICCGPYTDYRYLDSSGFISIPERDATKLCRWSALAHETFHSKIHNLLRAFDMIENENAKKGEEFANALFGHPWEEVNDKLTQLESTIVDLLKRRIGRIYRQLFCFLEDDFIVPKYFLEFQFVEILCDIASTLVCGPSDLIFMASTTAESCRNPLFGIRRHLLDLRHPPDAVRVRYEFDLLQFGDMDLRGTKGDIIGFIGDNLDELMGVDTLKECSELDKLSINLINLYFDIVQKFMPKFSEVISLLINKDVCFNRERWKCIMDSYEDIVNGKHNIGKLLPYDLTNIAWLRVIDIFKETMKKKGSYQQYWDNRDRENQFFRSLWDKALSLKATY